MTLLMVLNALMLVFLVVCAWLVRARVAAQHDLQEQVAQLRQALGILTDATEAGFATVTSRVALLPSVPANPRARRTPAAAARIRAAARRGRTPAEIAAEEGVSEGEIHLRLSLAETARDSAKAAGKNGVRKSRRSAPAPAVREME